MEKQLAFGVNCRLCANFYKVEKLLDLNEDKKMFEEITSIISFLNATYIDFSIHGLSLTICTKCYQSMVKVYEFLGKVQDAQQTLTSLSIFKKVMSNEVCSTSKEVHNVGNSASIIEVKNEQAEVEIKMELDDSNAINPLEDIDNQNVGPIDFLKVEADQRREKIEYPHKESKKEKDRIMSIIKNEIEKSKSTDSEEKKAKLFLLLNNEGEPAVLIKQIPLKIQQLSELAPKVTIKSNCPESLNSNSKPVTLDYNVVQNPKSLPVTTTNKKELPSSTSLPVTTKNKREIPNSNESSISKKTESDDDEFVKSPELPEIFESNKRCQICNITYKHRSALYLHRVKVHGLQKRNRPKGAPITQEDLTCKYCKKVFPKRSNVLDHISHNHRNTGVKETLICETCGFTTRDKSYLLVHIRSQHGTKPHVCKICSASYLSLYYLKEHVLTHSDEKTCSCPHCDAKFKRRNLLTAHVRAMHTHPQTFDCRYCEKSYRSKAGRICHERNHTGDFFECEPCGMKFTSWSNCDKHMKNKHNTTLAKNKHTPQGMLPIDPATGEVIQVQPTHPDLEQWKKQVLMAPSTKGRPSKPIPN